MISFTGCDLLRNFGTKSFEFHREGWPIGRDRINKRAKGLVQRGGRQRRSALDAGVIRYLAKPFVDAELLDGVTPAQARPSRNGDSRS
jgi:hypothetical protein